MAVEKDRLATYAQKEKELRLLAGIHAAIVKNVEPNDFATMLRAVENGGGQEVYPEGTVFYTEKDTYQYPWAVMHHGIDTDGEPYMDVRVIKGIDSLMFDNYEAIKYVRNGLAAGKYYITLPVAYGKTAAGNYTFTLTEDIPAGGRITGFVRASDVDADGTELNVFDTPNSKTASQTVTVTKGTQGTFLGSLQIAGDAENDMNSIQRCGYGSGNYAQSNIRQYLNSSAAAGSIWTPSNIYDQPPSYVDSTPGFMAKLPDEFLDIVCPVEFKVETNNVFEVDYETGTFYTLKDKFWLPSRMHIFGSNEVSSIDTGDVLWNYYKDATNEDRIMYNKNGGAVFQRLRAPFVGSAHHTRFVTASGAMYSNGAFLALAVAPACRIRRIKKSS